MTEPREVRKGNKLSKSEKRERNLLITKLQESGDFERLKKSAYSQLILHSEGERWMEEIKERTREAIQQSNGGSDSIEEITLDELSEAIAKNIGNYIPSSIEEDISSQIRQAYRTK